MKFKCGLTEAEEKAEKRRKVEKFKQYVINGKRKFAWLPVTIRKGRCVWLEFYLEFPDIGYNAEKDEETYRYYRDDLSTQWNPWPMRFREWRWERDKEYIIKEIL